jgi:hypothetical protein
MAELLARGSKRVKNIKETIFLEVKVLNASESSKICLILLPMFTAWKGFAIYVNQDLNEACDIFYDMER